MTKYHVNSAGEPGACSAKIECPFGGDQQHYSNPDNARKAFELSMAGETIKTTKKAAKKDISFADESRQQYDPQKYEDFEFDTVTYDEAHRRKNAVRSGDYSKDGALSIYMERDFKKWDQMTRTEIPKRPEPHVPARLIGEGSVISIKDPLAENVYRTTMLSPKMVGGVTVARFRDQRGNTVTAEANELFNVVLPSETSSPKWKKQNTEAAKLKVVRNQYNEDMVTRLLSDR